MYEVLFLDNLDSFSFNIVELLRKLFVKVTIYRSTNSLQTIILALEKMKNPILFLSPGPGTPQESGCLLKLIEKCLGKIPIVGICLGYQAIVQIYGGKICQSSLAVHGKTSAITHDTQDMFADLPNPLLVARYHSLVCKNIPNNLIVNARFKNVVMAVRNNTDRVCGFQFHPESILTLNGEELIQKVLLWTNKIKYK